MSREEEDYYQRRAETQLELARQASQTAVVQAHYAMATAYLDRIHAEPGDNPEVDHPAR